MNKTIERFILSVTLLPIIGAFIGFLWAICAGESIKYCMLLFAVIMVVVGIFTIGHQNED